MSFRLMPFLHDNQIYELRTEMLILLQKTALNRKIDFDNQSLSPKPDLLM